ncbi:MAG: DUF3817 domain-containing protein [Acidimicrobiales bacterium]
MTIGSTDVQPVRAAVIRYRVIAYITGILIIVVVFAGIPLQLAAHNTVITDQVATVHGVLYIVYIIMAWLLAMRLKLTRGPIVLLLLAGTIPVMTFVMERWLTRRYITPTLAAAVSGQRPTKTGGAPPAERADVPRRTVG